MPELIQKLFLQNRKIIWLIIAYLFLCQHIYSQNISDTIAIQEVQVFGKIKKLESTLNITYIDTLALKMMQNQSISELLSSFSPVFIKSYGRGSAATASFRGTASTHTHIYWNDIKLNSSMRGDYDFSLFPSYFVDDINIQHGGSSIISGSGSLGGSIIVRNKPVWSEKFSINYLQTIESFSTFKEFLNIGLGNNNWYLKSRVYSDKSENNFPYYNYGILPKVDTFQKNASYSKRGFIQEVYYKRHLKTYSAKVWLNYSLRNLPQLMTFEGSTRTETQEDINLNSVVSAKHNGEKLNYEFIIGLSNRMLDYIRSSQESNFVNFNSESSENNFSNKLKLEYEITPNLNVNSNFNIEIQNVKVNDLIQFSGYEKNRYSFSLLNAVNFQASDKLMLSLMLRNDLNNNDVMRFIPLAGIQFFADKSKYGFLKFNVGRNYNQPSLNDLYWIPGGNSELKPEDGITSDLSFNFRKKTEDYSISVYTSLFFSLIDNWIVWQPSKSGAYFWEANNLRKVFARGSEIQLSYHRKFANGISFNSNANYSLSLSSNVDAVKSVDESRGKQLIYIPKHKANFSAEANYEQYFIKMNTPFTGKRYTTSNNVESDYEKVLTPYFLVNIGAGRKFIYKRINFGLAMHIENLMNTDYMAILWRPMPGRYYSISVQISYKNNAN